MLDSGAARARSCAWVRRRRKSTLDGNSYTPYPH